MAYQEFAYFYDEFNGAADYDALFAYVTGELKAHGIQDGIVADFGCGTGELTLMLAQAGYDMIGIDVSEEMLSVLRDKADALGLPLTNPMLLCQDLLQLDLYGTIRAAVSTFDTYNHIGPLENFEKAIAKAAFFMEKDGVFVFDLNTPYKHEKVLSGQPCFSGGESKRQNGRLGLASRLFQYIAKGGHGLSWPAHTDGDPERGKTGGAGQGYRSGYGQD